MPEAHTSSEFDELLGRASVAAFPHGARASSASSTTRSNAWLSGSSLLVDQVLRHEIEINEMERSVDELAGTILVRRKPAARDLRLVLAFIKTTTDLEASPTRRRRSRCARAASRRTAGRAGRGTSR
jgi:phosphate transport system protein